MIRKKIKVQNKHGLHARPCSMLVKTASQFRSEFSINKDDLCINGKSIMGVMMLAAEYGSELELVLNGIDEKIAMESIEKMFESKFLEE